MMTCQNTVGVKGIRTGSADGTVTTMRCVNPVNTTYSFFYCIACYSKRMADTIKRVNTPTGGTRVVNAEKRALKLRIEPEDLK